MAREKDAWRSSVFARGWDLDNLRGNPERLAQVDLLVSIALAHHRKGGQMVSLGVGSGQVEAELLARDEDVRIIGVDFSAAMLRIARDRLRDWKARVQLIELDVTKLEEARVPFRRATEVVYSVQMFHELRPQEKRRTLRLVANLLRRDDGVFLVADRIDVPRARFGKVFAAAWTRSNERSPIRSPLSYRAREAQLRTREDYPSTLPGMMEDLSGAGLEAVPVDVRADRALFAARLAQKPTSRRRSP